MPETPGFYCALIYRKQRSEMSRDHTAGWDNWDGRLKRRWQEKWDAVVRRGEKNAVKNVAEKSKGTSLDGFDDRDLH